jgi:hypothetical protein
VDKRRRSLRVLDGVAELVLLESEEPVPRLVDLVLLVGREIGWQLGAGCATGYALHADGTVSSWGPSYFGQLGNGSTATSNVPITVSGLTGAVSVGSGPGSGTAFAVL